MTSTANPISCDHLRPSGQPWQEVPSANFCPTCGQALAELPRPTAATLLRTRVTDALQQARELCFGRSDYQQGRLSAFGDAIAIVAEQFEQFVQEDRARREASHALADHQSTTR